MTKPMNDKARARWGRLRERGWGWHVFVHGAVIYGGPWGAFMLLFRYWDAAQQWQGLARELPLMIAVAAAFGVICGWMEWRREERRFAEAGDVSIQSA